MELVAAISRSNAGKALGDVIGVKGLDTPIYGTAAEALQSHPDVLVEYTKPEVAKSHILAALRSGANVVVGTSGLSNEDYEEIDTLAKQMNRGVLAVGNFALTVGLLQKFAETAAKYIPHWEIIDYAHSEKRDAPEWDGRAGEPPGWHPGVPAGCHARGNGGCQGNSRRTHARYTGPPRPAAGIRHFDRRHFWDAGPEAAFCDTNREPALNRM